ncbi:glyoxalase/bleomycin resistance protein/dioxygenase [Lepidopterella palustris CBS 459.81]|uniref:Glyoxalase/bleomycin resistance protein/dioxygenase n=1 Tax=Lepidopterella palustris CBS 459.81 TaxID=1314670 RepID=A0A8E2JJ12_9PEZI|nr:glyoxalase/bleomycin resistance protein/dioxygenase [Lepidopterella palustris CBS 459.81]
MTINHLFLYVSSVRMPALQAFYKRILEPIGYTEMLRANEGLVGYGSDYPYFWLKALPENRTPMLTHIAFDAPSIHNKAVDAVHAIAIKEGGKDNGGPGIRVEMSRQPYYSAFVFDLEGNNIEAVCVKK